MGNASERFYFYFSATLGGVAYYLSATLGGVAYYLSATLGCLLSTFTTLFSSLQLRTRYPSPSSSEKGEKKRRRRGEEEGKKGKLTGG
ncbi:MAG: hypothetical protein IJU19_03335 [Bacteroidales bacterium]|nr:hypothetical protein [Bacteroidales bacterium]